MRGLARALVFFSAARGAALAPAERARAAVRAVDAAGAGCGAEARHRAAFYALHPEQFWGDEPCRGLVDRIAASAAADASAGPVVGLDVGANVGDTLDAVHRCCGGGAASVVAFECNPRNVPIVEAAAAARPFSVRVVARAASDVAGADVAFDLPGGSDQAGRTFGAETPGNPFGAVRPGEAAAAGAIAVRTTTVDAEVDVSADVAFAKIDVEGHEAAVLRGMASTLARTRVLLVEASDLARGAGPAPVRDLAAFFDDRGFDCYRVGFDCLLPLWGAHYHPVYDEFAYWSNVVAVRRGLPFAADARASADVAGLDPVLDDALEAESRTRR